MKQHPKIFLIFVLALFVIQLYLLLNFPWWGPESRFPMTLIRSPVVPAAYGTIALFGLFSASSNTQKNILYSIIIASAVELIMIMIMVRFDEPALVAMKMTVTSFATFQFLQYGNTLFAADVIKGTKANTISGVVFRLSIVVFGGLLIS
jgi:hypothetical protein